MGTTGKALVGPPTMGPAAKQQVLDKIAGAETRAARRLALARLTRYLRKKDGGSYAEVRAEMLVWVEAGILALAPDEIPGAEQLRRLERRFAAGAESLDDYTDRGARGPAPMAFPEVFEKALDQAARANTVRRRLRGVWRDAQREAERLAGEGRGAVAVPSYATFRRRFLTHKSQRERLAAFQGSRHAELTAGPHGVIPARESHDVWSLDEYEAPKAYRLQDPRSGEWFSWYPAVVKIRDRFSGAIVAAHLAVPTRRLDVRTGRPARSGFDADDVTAALVSAGVPELALPPCRPFSGALCATALRLDRHRTHATLRTAAMRAAKQLVIGVDAFYREDDTDAPDVPAVVATPGPDPEPSVLPIPTLPVRRPKSRGDIENTIGFVKENWPDGPGHKGRHRPTDRILVDDDARVRSAGAAAGAPELRTTPIDVMQLGTLKDAQRDLEEVVQWYNFEHRSEEDGRTAAERFEIGRTRHQRPGRDVLALCETRMLTPDARGVRVRHRGVRAHFSPFVSAAGVQLEPNVERPVKLDPLLRCVWVRLQPGGAFVRLDPAPNREPDLRYRNKVVEAQQVAREASDDAEALRRATTDAMVGPGAAQFADAKARQAREQLRAERREEERDELRAELRDVQRDVRRSNEDAVPGSVGPTTDGSTRPDTSADATPRLPSRVSRVPDPFEEDDDANDDAALPGGGTEDRAGQRERRTPPSYSQRFAALPDPAEPATPGSATARDAGGSTKDGAADVTSADDEVGS